VREKSGGNPEHKYTQRWILMASDLWRRSWRSVVTKRAWGGGRFRPGDEALFGFFNCLDRRARARALVDRAQGRPICARSCGDVSRAFWQSAPSDRSRCTPSVLACPVPLARKPYGSSRCAWVLPPLSPRQFGRQFGDRASGSCPRIVAWAAEFRLELPLSRMVTYDELVADRSRR
jgi:hypothetical protein